MFQEPLFTPTPKAAKRVLEFFTAQINNDHTWKAYVNAERRFAEWCDLCREELRETSWVRHACRARTQRLQ